METTVFKEATDFIELARRKLLQISQVAVLRIVNTNCNCLVIFLTLYIQEENTPLLRQH
jgi:hypothetical protein